MRFQNLLNPQNQHTKMSIWSFNNDINIPPRQTWQMRQKTAASWRERCVRRKKFKYH